MSWRSWHPFVESPARCHRPHRLGRPVGRHSSSPSPTRPLARPLRRRFSPTCRADVTGPPAPPVPPPEPAAFPSGHRELPRPLHPPTRKPGRHRRKSRSPSATDRPRASFADAASPPLATNTGSYAEPAGRCAVGHGHGICPVGSPGVERPGRTPDAPARPASTHNRTVRRRTRSRPVCPVLADFDGNRR